MLKLALISSTVPYIRYPKGRHMRAIQTPSLQQHSLHDPIRVCLRGKPNLDHREPSLLQQRAPLLLGPLHARVETHHRHVQHGMERRGALLGNEHLVYQQLGVPRLHGRLDLCQDVEADVVRPVVQDVVVEVGSRA